MRRVYLDHSATTPVDPRVVEAMLPYLTEKFGNASSVHLFGQEARAAVDRARRQVASLIGARANEIVFTSGGTESNNLAIRGICEIAEARGFDGRSSDCKRDADACRETIASTANIYRLFDAVRPNLCLFAGFDHQHSTAALRNKQQFRLCNLEQSRIIHAAAAQN